jgi:serine/threonine-protein kinase
LDYKGEIDWSKENFQLGIQMLERAVELDPEFALAYAELSGAHSNMHHFGHDRTEERLSRAKAAVDKALELQPELPEAHLQFGYYYYYGYRDYERALEELAIAEKGLPNNSRILTATAFIWRRQGKFEAAVDRLEVAFELSPQNAGLAAYNYVSWLGDTKRARDVLEKMPGKRRDVQERSLELWRLERNYQAILDFASSDSRPIIWYQSDVWLPALLAARAYRLMGQAELAHASYDSARAILEKELDTYPDDHRIHSALGTAYAGLGRKEDAIREGKRGVELYAVSKDALGGLVRVWDLAVIYTMVGEYDAALDEIEYVLSVSGWYSVQNLRLDPIWDPLREHPRFQALLERYAID